MVEFQYIRINKAKKSIYWYSKYIGSQFKLYRTKKTHWLVYIPETRAHFGKVYKTDGEIIK